MAQLYRMRGASLSKAKIPLASVAAWASPGHLCAHICVPTSIYSFKFLGKSNKAALAWGAVRFSLSRARHRYLQFLVERPEASRVASASGFRALGLGRENQTSLAGRLSSAPWQILLAQRVQPLQGSWAFLGLSMPICTHIPDPDAARIPAYWESVASAG